MLSQVTSAKNKPQENRCIKSNPDSCALNLLNQGIFYSTASLSYGFSLGSAGVFYSQSNYFDNNKLYTYGVNFTTALYQTSSGSWQLNLNASRRQDETNIFATISYNFNDSHKSGTIGSGYGYFRNNYLPANTTPITIKRSSEGLTTQGNILWHNTNDTNYGYTVGIQCNTTPDVYADDQLIQHIHANRNYLIKLRAYTTWRISISDTSKNLHHFDKEDRVITLYPGNIQTLNWQTSRVIAVAGQVVNEHKKPIAKALVKGGLDFAITDSEGYFQTTIREQDRGLSFYTSEDTCRIDLPKKTQKDNVLYLGKLTCYPFKSEN